MELVEKQALTDKMSNLVEQYAAMPQLLQAEKSPAQLEAEAIALRDNHVHGQPSLHVLQQTHVAAHTAAFGQIPEFSEEEPQFSFDPDSEPRRYPVDVSANVQRLSHDDFFRISGLLISSIFATDD